MLIPKEIIDLASIAFAVPLPLLCQNPLVKLHRLSMEGGSGSVPAHAASRINAGVCNLAKVAMHAAGGVVIEPGSRRAYFGIMCATGAQT